MAEDKVLPCDHAYCRFCFNRLSDSFYCPACVEQESEICFECDEGGGEIGFECDKGETEMGLECAEKDRESTSICAEEEIEIGFECDKGETEMGLECAEKDRESGSGCVEEEREIGDEGETESGSEYVKEETVSSSECAESETPRHNRVVSASKSVPKDNSCIGEEIEASKRKLRQSKSAPEEEMFRLSTVWGDYLSEIPCQVCIRREKQIVATAKCTDCSRFLCESCKSIHDKVPAYEEHIVVLLNDENRGPSKILCKGHDQKMSNVCVHIKCLKYLCVDCTFTEEHADHVECIFDINKGIKKAKEIAEAQIIDVQSLWNKLNTKLELGNANVNRLNELVIEINETRENITEQVDKETNKIHDELNIKYKQPIMQHNQRCAKLQEDAANLVDMFRDLEKCDVMEKVDECKTIIETGDELKRKGKACLEFSKTVPVLSKNLFLNIVELGNLIETDSETMDALEHTFEDRHLQNPRLVEEIIHIHGVKLCRPVQICTLDKDSVLVADASLSYVSRINQKGKLLSTYHSQSTQGTDKLVNAVAVSVDYLYVADNHGFSVFPRSPLRSVNYVRCGTKIVDLCPWGSKKLLILNHDPGTLILFDMECSDSEVVLDSLKEPLYLSAGKTMVGPRIVITERDQHIIKIFDEHFEHLTSFGVKGRRDSQIMFPYATALTSSNLLLLDGGNHRISLFTLSGVFIRHVVTEKDGLKWPTSIAYQKGLLWVTECIESDKDKHAAIKCFQFVQ